MGTRKIPQRRCVGCGRMRDKKDMIRILRTPEGEWVADAAGKKNGRGAYLCPDMACFEAAVKSRGLERSFKAAVPKELYGALKKELEGLGG